MMKITDTGMENMCTHNVSMRNGETVHFLEYSLPI
jgi:hypothetical protein